MNNTNRNISLFLIALAGLLSIIYFIFSVFLQIFNHQMIFNVLISKIIFLLLSCLSFFVVYSMLKKSPEKIKNIIFSFYQSFFIIFLALVVGSYINFIKYNSFLGEVLLASLFAILVIFLYSLIFSLTGFLYNFSQKYIALFNTILGIIIIICAYFNFPYTLNILILFLTGHILSFFYYRNPVHKPTQNLLIFNYLVALPIFVILSLKLEFYYQVYFLFFVLEFSLLYFFKKTSPKYNKYLLLYNILLTPLFICLLF